MNKIARKLITDFIIIRNPVMVLSCNRIHSYVNPPQDALQCEAKGYLETNVVGDVKNNLAQNVNNIGAGKVNSVVDILYNSFGNSQLCYQDLNSSNEFMHICNIIQTHARTLNIYDIIRVLHILHSLHVPTNTVLMQTLLQLIRASLNDLSFGQVIKVYNILKKLEASSLVRSLLVALPSVFMQQARSNLNSESPNLVKTLRFACTINDMQTRSNIIKILLYNKKNINIDSIVDIFFAVYTLPELCPYSKKLLFKLNNQIVANADLLNYVRIEQLLFHISKTYRNLDKTFYWEAGIDALCTALLKKKVPFTEGTRVLKQLNRMLYSSTPLLDYLSKQCVQDTDQFKKISYIDVNHFIKGLVIADYRPDGWETIKTMLKDSVIDRDISIRNMATIALNLLSLDCYYPELLERLFRSYNRISNYMKSDPITLTTLRVYWCVRLLYPEYDGTFINESKIDRDRIKDTGYRVNSITECLKKVIGSTKYMKRDLITKFGQLVDCAVILEADGTFMNISQYEVTYVEELTTLSDSTKILFLVLPENAYPVNKRNIISTIKMQLKAIQSLPGIRLFVIDPLQWDTLSSAKRMLHIREAIKLNGHSAESMYTLPQK